MKLLKLFWLFFCPVVAAAPCAQLSGQARAALRQQGFAAALQLLQPMEAQCAGEPAFDYLLGSSLLHTGQPDAASWALERVTANDPRHGGAWLDLAEAYWRLGDAPRAGEALQHAILLNPPAAARANILALQQALHEMQTPWRHSGYATVAYGRDSNVNSATALSTIGIPSLGNLSFILDQGSRHQSSTFRDVELGGMLGWKSVTAGEYYLQPKIKNRYYADLHAFNRDIYSIQAGHGQHYAAGDLITSLQYEKQWLGGRPYLQTRGVSAEWRSSLPSRGQLRLSGQYSSDRYADQMQNSNDVDQYSLGLSFSQGFAHDQGRWTLAMIRSNELAQRSRVYGDKRSLLLYADVSVQLLPNLNAQLSLAHQADDYQKIDPAFLQVRSERQWCYSAGVSSSLARNVLLSANLSIIHNDANIPVYGYERRVSSLSLRRDF